MPSQLCNAVLGGESGHGGCPPDLRAGRDGDHDGGLFLTFLRLFNGEATSAADGREDVEKVDREHGIEEHLTVTLRHSMALQPAIDNDEVFDLHCEAWGVASADLSGFALLPADGHIFQRLELAGTDFDRSGGLIHQRLGLSVIQPG